jgi:hypothetical protein
VKFHQASDWEIITIDDDDKDGGNGGGGGIDGEGQGLEDYHNRSMEASY